MKTSLGQAHHIKHIRGKVIPEKPNANKSKPN